MSIQRKIERTQLKKQWKEHNQGVKKNTELILKDFGIGIKKEREVRGNGSNDN